MLNDCCGNYDFGVLWWSMFENAIQLRVWGGDDLGMTICSNRTKNNIRLYCDRTNLLKTWYRTFYSARTSLPNIFVSVNDSVAASLLKSLCRNIIMVRQTFSKTWYVTFTMLGQNLFQSLISECGYVLTGLVIETIIMSEKVCPNTKRFQQVVWDCLS